jgi:MFS family permease
MTAATIETRPLLKRPEFVYLVVSRLFAALAGIAFATTIGLQVYRLTHDPLALGLIGLIEAIPALSLALLGGYIADHYDRRKLTLITSVIEVACMALLFVIALSPERFGISAIYIAIFIYGMAAGFNRPAFSAFEQQVIPNDQVARATSTLSSVSQAGAIVGGPIAGFVIAGLGIPAAYAFVLALLTLSVALVFLIKPRPMPTPIEGETIWQSLRAGVRFVARSQPLVGSMALDLFAVLFGGAMALLPVFADDILHVGAIGLGWLRTAPSLGALVVMLWATRRPPTHNAGRNLLIVVAAFGVSFIVFALSQNFWLSMLALFFSGVFDGISMIIRGVIVRVMSPEAMRGRIAAVSWMFIGASNEVGAFESGVAASLLGTAASVFWGAVVTLGVVAVVAATMPKLRNLRLSGEEAVPE